VLVRGGSAPCCSLCFHQVVDFSGRGRSGAAPFLESAPMRSPSSLVSSILGSARSPSIFVGGPEPGHLAFRRSAGALSPSCCCSVFARRSLSVRFLRWNRHFPSAPLLRGRVRNASAGRGRTVRHVLTPHPEEVRAEFERGFSDCIDRFRHAGSRRMPGWGGSGDAHATGVGVQTKPGGIGIAIFSAADDPPRALRQKYCWSRTTSAP